METLYQCLATFALPTCKYSEMECQEITIHIKKTEIAPEWNQKVSLASWFMTCSYLFLADIMQGIKVTEVSPLNPLSSGHCTYTEQVHSWESISFVSGVFCFNPCGENSEGLAISSGNLEYTMLQNK